MGWHSLLLRMTATGLLVAAGIAPAAGQIAAYSPYADSQGIRPPVAADGTIHWGAFYKSASLQKTYERLWHLGACRGTSKAITVPVELNKLDIDSLPEAEFRGIVQSVEGSNAGGMISFVAADAGDGSTVRVALLHPAGVSQVVVTGSTSPLFLAAGMTVRVHSVVDAKGRGTAPVEHVEVLSPASNHTPAALEPGRGETIVGRIVQVRHGVLQLRVDAGKIRRLSLPLAENVAVSVDGSQLNLVSPGDSITLKGRLWTGEGALASGNVFASQVAVIKAPLLRGGQ